MKIFSNNRAVSLNALAAVLVAGLMPGIATAADYPPPGDAQRGAQIWADNCGRCHNIRGPQNQRDDQWITSMFHMRIRAGLTGQQTRDVLTFLQSSNRPPSALTAAPSGDEAPSETEATSGDTAAAAGRQQVAGNVSAGRSIYSQSCAACHGSSGQGAFSDVPNIRGRLGKPASTLVQNVIRGFQSPGSAMAMPPKGGNPGLSTADIQSVVAYMKATFR